MTATEEAVANYSSSATIEVKETEEVGDDETDVEESIELIIELPRDILTGYILCRLTGVWEKHTIKGKSGVYGGLLIAYLVQFAVFFSFIAEIKFENVNVPLGGEEWFFNLISIAVLFMYIWKDLVAFHTSVWFWITYVEKNSAVVQQLKAMRNRAKAKLQHKKDVGDNAGGGTAEDNTGQSFNTKENVIEGARFLEFRIWLISVYVLYFGFAMYSLIQIGASTTLIDKIEVSLSIFFVLEIDDWANELFIIQTGILDDDDFDVKMILPNETEDDKLRRSERRVIYVMCLLTGSVLLVWVLSNWRALFEQL